MDSPTDNHSGWQMLNPLDSNSSLYTTQNTWMQFGRFHCHNIRRHTCPNTRPMSTQLLNHTYPLDTLYMPMHHRWNNTPWHKMPDRHLSHWSHNNLH